LRADRHRAAALRRIVVGSDSYDNALAEAVNDAYKTELINRGKPWRRIDDVELAAAAWLAWYNQERLHEALGYRSPAEYEAALSGTSQPASQLTPALAATRNETRGMPLAEQHDEWIEGRRYPGLDVLTRARAILTSTNQPEGQQTTITPALTA